MKTNGFYLPNKYTQLTDESQALKQMRRALVLEMYGSLKWFGAVESGDAPKLAEQIRRRKRKAQ